MLAFTLLALFSGILLPAPAPAQNFPKYTGLVVDDANVLPADRKAALEAKLEAFQKTTQRQFVVATIADLQGYAIEDYGYRLGRSWGVGLKDADNGIILIIAPRDRKVRIEVGRRLEPVMTDALSSIIIRTRILPAFKAGDIPAGIEAGADAVIAQLSAPDDQAKAQTAKAAADFDKVHKRSTSGGGIPFGLIFWVLVVGFVILAMRRGRSGAAGPWGQQRYRSDDGGGHGWIWLWAASELIDHAGRGDRSSGWGGGSSLGGGDGGGSDGSWGGGGFTGGGGGDFGGGGASGDW